MCSGNVLSSHIWAERSAGPESRCPPLILFDGLLEVEDAFVEKLMKLMVGVDSNLICAFSVDLGRLPSCIRIWVSPPLPLQPIIMPLALICNRK